MKKSKFLRERRKQFYRSEKETDKNFDKEVYNKVYKDMGDQIKSFLNSFKKESDE